MKPKTRRFLSIALASAFFYLLFSAFFELISDRSMKGFIPVTILYAFRASLEAILWKNTGLPTKTSITLGLLWINRMFAEYWE